MIPINVLCIVTTLVIAVTTREFRLGMFSPFRHPRLGWENNAAAATIAVERAQSEGILAGHNISILWLDDECSPLGGARCAVTFRENDVDVFIGPPCSGSTLHAGLLAVLWNLPVFSQASSDPALADKSVYKTLVRLGPPFNKLGKALAELFHYFRWESVVMITKRRTDNRNVFCDYSARGVQQAFEDTNIVMNDLIHIDPGISDAEIVVVLNRAKKHGRVILLCTEIHADRRRILLKAHELGMTGGDYLYIMPDHLPPANVRRPWETGSYDDAIVRLAYNSVFQVTVSEMAGPEVESFRDLVTEKMAEAPWFYNDTKTRGLRGSVYSPFLHDVVYLYLFVLNETLAAGADHRDGTAMFQRAKGKLFKGITGTVKVDENGDREPDYWVWDLVPGQPDFTVALEARLTSADTEKIHSVEAVVWETEDGLPPPSTPKCGFLNEKCSHQASGWDGMYVVLTVGMVLLLGMALVGLFLYRRARHIRDIELQLWRVDYKDLKFTNQRVIGSISMISLRTPSVAISTQTTAGQVFSRLGYYRGNVVAVKQLYKCQLQLDNNDLIELNAMKAIQHENVNIFFGLSLDVRYPCMLTMYCSKGSLEDLIGNDDIKLDWMFKVSLISDLTNAMLYLHESPLCVHGNLKSSNCLVDNRWVLKVTDYGLYRIRHLQSDTVESEYRISTALFWTAPEILRMVDNVRSSQKGDVYACGVVLFQILYRTAPYDTVMISPTRVLKRIRITEDPPFRPTLLTDNDEVNWKCSGSTTNSILELLAACWAEDPTQRPNFTAIRHETAKLIQGKKLNIVDNMVMMLERYANNLEDVVENRTLQLLGEKKKTDALLYRMLPQSVAERLKNGEVVQPEIYESVTIFFSDIVGFTELSSEVSPIEIVDMLNDLYTLFDSTIDRHDVYKVETIGDAYMVVSGLPERNGRWHCVAIANMSLDLRATADQFKMRNRPDKRLQLRIGIHTGTCAAGVVGRTMPRYCLFGDTVNMASRMESTGEAMKIHLSGEAQAVLDKTLQFVMQRRGSVEVKGKGTLQTYWLLHKYNTTTISRGTVPQMPNSVDDL